MDGATTLAGVCGRGRFGRAVLQLPHPVPPLPGICVHARQGAWCAGEKKKEKGVSGRLACVRERGKE